MTKDWAIPCAVSLVVGLLATPLARKLALAIGLVDHPEPRKAHRRPTPYLGGAAIALSVFVGCLISPSTGLGTWLVFCALALMVLGLIDDYRTIGPFPRLLTETAVSVAAVVGLGVHLDAGTETLVSTIGTVLLLVLVTNSVNLLDNMDGLAAGVTAIGAAGALATTSAFAKSPLLGVSASLLGACLAFLVFNARQASIFMGDAGSLFLGFLLTATAVQVGAAMKGADRFIFPLLLLAVPLADTTTVVIARIRNHRPVMSGGQDHLSHRLACAGLGRSNAVAVLVATEACSAALAVLMGRRVVPWGWALTSGLLLELGLVAFACRIQIYDTASNPVPVWIPWRKGEHQGGAAPLRPPTH